MLNESFAQALGNRIKDARIDRDLKQTELGERLGASQSSVGYWESGKRGVPLDKIVPLCKVLRVTPGYLFGAEPIDAPRRVMEQYDGFRNAIRKLQEENENLRSELGSMS